MSGADCYGLAYLFGKSIGIDLPEYLEKPCLNSNEISDSINQEKHRFQKISRNGLKKGDLILFNILGKPIHIGIVISSNLMLHSFEGNGFSSIESFDSQLWKKRIDSFWRLIQ